MPDKKNEQELKVTSIEEIKRRAEGHPVSLPGWDEEPWIARLRRPALNSMVLNGEIPNELLPIVEELFEDTQQTTDSESPGIEKTAQLFHLMAEKALVEPKYEQVSHLLTDEQLIAIFHYAQAGVRALEKFRRRQGFNGQGGLDIANLGN